MLVKREAYIQNPKFIDKTHSMTQEKLMKPFVLKQDTDFHKERQEYAVRLYETDDGLPHRLRDVVKKAA